MAVHEAHTLQQEALCAISDWDGDVTVLKLSFQQTPQVQRVWGIGYMVDGWVIGSRVRCPAESANRFAG